MMNKKEPTYNKVQTRLSDEEIVDSFVFRHDLSEKEKKEADEELLRLRLKRLKEMSDEQVLHSELMRMKLLMKSYFKQNKFDENFSFSNQLKKYIELLKKSHIEFARDIDIHKTKLSRVLNDRENPNIELMYRLEKHSGKLIPANYWYKLHSKKLEQEIKINKDKRKEEYKRVKNQLKFKISA